MALRPPHVEDRVPWVFLLALGQIGKRPLSRGAKRLDPILNDSHLLPKLQGVVAVRFNGWG